MSGVLEWLKPAVEKPLIAIPSYDVCVCLCSAAHLCLTPCDPTDCSTPGPCPWDSLGMDTREGCHFLLPCDVYHSIIYNIKQWKNFNKYLVFGEWVICMILIYVLKIIKIISFLYNFYIKVFLFLYNFKKWNIF